MLIIPVSRRPDWRKPPVVTLLLIAVNILIFFGLQDGDDEKTHKAYEYYETSILVKTELPRYVEYLKTANDPEKAEWATKALEAERWYALRNRMEDDAVFMERLRAGKIIPPDDPEYPEWRRQRDEFERMRDSTMIGRFALKSAQPTLAGLMGYMFLHGSFDHLLGNMAFLFVVGYMVEEVLGKWRYLLFYLLAGIGSGVCKMAIGEATMIPLVGASGAISGVMAMYVTLYGMQKIRFFYWVIVYFNFFRAPAIIMLPFWIALELYQYFMNPDSMVSYLTHLGGFITGAALIGLVRLSGGKPLTLPQQETTADPRDVALAKVDKLLNALRLDAARRELRRLTARYPDDLVIVNRYYQVARHAPASDDYHHAAALVFSLSDEHPASGKLIYETFVDYLKLAKPTVRFRVQDLIALIRSLARSGHAVDAERLTRVLANRSPQQKELPSLLLLVAQAFSLSGDALMHDTVLSRLRQNYPDSKEARI